jgi:hypothetical protein
VRIQVWRLAIFHHFSSGDHFVLYNEVISELLNRVYQGSSCRITLRVLLNNLIAIIYRESLDVVVDDIWKLLRTRSHPSTTDKRILWHSGFDTTSDWLASEVVVIISAVLAWQFSLTQHTSSTQSFICVVRWTLYTVGLYDAPTI